MTENPYAAPRSSIQSESNRISDGPVLLYSPTQVACGTIGGPVGLIYFLRANFLALGNIRAAKLTLWYGILGIACLIAILPLLPDKFPSTPFTLIYIFVARQISEKYQMTKESIAASADHDFQSNWRVFGLGLLCLCATAVVIMVPLFLLIMMGLWSP